jgi:hypothetical protein
MLQSWFVAPEEQLIASARLEVGLQALDQLVVLVANRGMGIFEDGLCSGGHGFLGQVQRCRVLVDGDGPARLVARVDPEQLAIGDRHGQHDVGVQRVDDDHVVERVPPLFGNIFQFENRVEREDQPVMRPVRVEHRAVAARDPGEGPLMDGGEMVVLREGIDRQLPVDRGVEDLLTQRRPPADAPRVELVGQRSQVCRDVQGGARI